MDGACSSHGGDEKFIDNFSQRTSKEEIYSETYILVFSPAIGSVHDVS
jgi:hypothetical protein